MESKKYFKKNGFIYGVATRFIATSKRSFYQSYFVKFTKFSKAEAWLELESSVFPEKKLISKSDLDKLDGQKYEIDEEHLLWRKVWKK